MERDLAVADKLAQWLDSKYSVGGVRFGFDTIIGLLPGVGDGATALLALYPVYLAGRHNLGGWTVFRMLTNVLLDFVIGLVPLLGDAGDLVFKSNRRNFVLFKRAAEKRLA